MATVILARQKSLDRQVAVKFMAGAAFPAHEATERFFREARMLAKLDHPNVLTIYDMGVEADQPFLVLEYVQGESVRDRLNRDGRIPHEEAARIALMVARGLAYAHDKEILHRDVKPENVLLSREGGIKLLDFGLGKLLEVSQNISHGGVILGTPAYLAPELILGEQPHKGSDIYTVGVLLYEMLCGQTPFGDSAEPDKLLERTKMEAPMTPVQQACTDRRLLEVLERAIRKDPAARFQHAFELVESLELYSGVSADPRINRSAARQQRPEKKPSTGERKRPRKTGRTRVLQNVPVRGIAAVVAFLAAVATGLGVWIVQPGRAPIDPAVLEVLSGVEGGRVRWRSDRPYVGTVVVRGPSTPEIALRESAPTTDHEFTISNLKRGTPYELTVGDDSGALFPVVPLKTAVEIDAPKVAALEPESAERATVRLDFNVPVTIVARPTASELMVTGGDNHQITHRLVISGPGAGIGMYELDLQISPVEGRPREHRLVVQGAFEHLATYVQSPLFARELAAVDQAWVESADRPDLAQAAARRVALESAGLRNRAREIEWLGKTLSDKATSFARRARLYGLLVELERFNRILPARHAYQPQGARGAAPADIVPLGQALEDFAESEVEEQPVGPMPKNALPLYLPPGRLHPALLMQWQDVSTAAKIVLGDLPSDPKSAPPRLAFEAFMRDLPADGRVLVTLKARCLSSAVFVDLDINREYKLRFFGRDTGLRGGEGLGTAVELAQASNEEFERRVPARVAHLTVPAALFRRDKNALALTGSMIAPSMATLNSSCMTIVHWLSWMPVR